MLEMTLILNTHSSSPQSSDRLGEVLAVLGEFLGSSHRISNGGIRIILRTTCDMIKMKNGGVYTTLGS